jgi:hypothetical protein
MENDTSSIKGNKYTRLFVTHARPPLWVRHAWYPSQLTEKEIMHVVCRSRLRKPGIIGTKCSTWGGCWGRCDEFVTGRGEVVGHPAIAQHRIRCQADHVERGSHAHVERGSRSLVIAAAGHLPEHLVGLVKRDLSWGSQATQEASVCQQRHTTWPFIPGLSSLPENHTTS